MSVRLYFGNEAPPVSPAYDAAWEVTASAIRRNLEFTQGQGSAAFENKGVGGTLNSPAGAVDVLLIQYTSDPLSADQTISGAIKGQIRALSSNAAADLDTQMVIWVMKTDGTSRGTLIAVNTAALANEWFTSSRNIKLPKGGSTVPTSVAALATDRIVVELGYRKHESATTSRTGTVASGNPTGTDLAEDETTTTANVGWIEFADTLTFTSDYVRVTQVAVEVLEAPDTSLVNARVTQVAVEVLEQPDISLVSARVTQVAVEVLHANVSTPQPMSAGIIG